MEAATFGIFFEHFAHHQPQANVYIPRFARPPATTSNTQTVRCQGFARERSDTNIQHISEEDKEGGDGEDPEGHPDQFKIEQPFIARFRSSEEVSTEPETIFIRRRDRKAKVTCPGCHI